MRISKQSAVPIYHQIAQAIGDRIKSGELRPGDMIPSEAQLCREYRVSRMTVRRGLELLTEAGYLETARGKGTFVARPRLENLTVDLAMLQRYRVRLLAAEVVPAAEEVASRLGLEPGGRVICVRRLYSGEEGPVALDRKCLPYTKGKPVLEADMAYAELPEMAQIHTDVLPVRSELVISARALGPGEAEVLREEPGAPALVIEQTVYAQGGRPIGSGVLVCRGGILRLKAVSRPY
ncbi:MAG: GntR family transcriptional regulator [Clostridia bacterium]|jgi:GntR family transcriptional regulator|nr:GntR family transcriptional regulator [Clostridia bacterium]MDH7573072.1 GntR family transcriptional regulator [Clostridia bacterium]